MAKRKCMLCANHRCSGAHNEEFIADVPTIERMLKQGWSQSAIALEMNCSRGYVAAIQKGARLAPLCEFCGAAFYPKRTGSRKPRFCGEPCAHSFARGEKGVR
jgi:hypothetical protein